MPYSEKKDRNSELRQILTRWVLDDSKDVHIVEA